MVQLEERSATDLFEPVFCFNSYMVQLEANLKSRSNPPYSVLIPIWCNWKQLLLQCRHLLSSVLIPIWCNWKTRVKAEADRAKEF